MKQIISMGYCGNNIKYKLYANGTLFIIGTGDMENYTDYITPWFSLNDKIKNVIIEKGVTSIRKGAFFNCKSLTNITIPETINCIGNYAFEFCKSLRKITIPNGVTSIGYAAFSECTALANITIPESVKEIGYRAFDNCKSLEHIYYKGTPAEWEKINYYDFKNIKIHFKKEVKV